MRLVRRHPDRLVFHLRGHEGFLLRELLDYYPCMPAGSQRLSRTATGPAAEENQRLLEEALEEQRRDHRRQLAAFLGDPERFKDTESGWRLALRRGEADWLLQVLNEIRVGSWVRLGSPDFEAGVNVKLNDQTIPHLWAMDMAAHFESPLIHALGGA